MDVAEHGADLRAEHALQRRRPGEHRGHREPELAK